MQPTPNPLPQSAPQSAPPGYDHRPYAAPQGYATPHHDVRAGFESQIAGSIVNGSIWMRLFAYMAIVVGGIYCLSIIGLVVGWIPIMLGLWLLGADKAGQQYANTGDPEQLHAYIDGVRKYFMVMGICAAIWMALFTLMAVVYGALFGTMAVAALSGQ
ncbi:MAG: hypothetical protein ACI81R_001037 [Bradymonadia bacterium]|jgi:hypothetical protein